MVEPTKVADTSQVTLSDALARYLSTRKDEDRQVALPELNRFVRWFGGDKRIAQITPHDVAEYAGMVSGLAGDAARRLEQVKGFLSFLKQKGLIQTSLAPHLKAPRGKAKKNSANLKRQTAEKVYLSPEGYAQLKARLDLLKEERVSVVADIQRAMADKDFRENAPLDAAKERQGFIEANIRELESLLGRAVVTEQQGNGSNHQYVTLGKKVNLKDLASGQIFTYHLVDPKEANPALNKISVSSPVGKALLDRRVGEEVQISVPRGTLRYKIEGVEG